MELNPIKGIVAVEFVYHAGASDRLCGHNRLTGESTATRAPAADAYGALVCVDPSRESYRYSHDATLNVLRIKVGISAGCSSPLAHRLNDLGWILIQSTAVNRLTRARIRGMIHGYHVIFGTYGFWLPNDPRGSWSDYVYSWELARYGKATKSLDRVDVAPAEFAMWRADALRALAYPPVSLNGEQARAVGEGFAKLSSKSQLGIWACSILPEHVHLVLGRHRYKMEIAANLLKGAATKRLNDVGLHPMSDHKHADGRIPHMWAKQQWIAYLDCEQSIENAIRYVEANPVRESKRLQTWNCVIPFTGISTWGWTTYH